MAFSHGDAALDLHAVLIVNDAVQDAFGDGTAFVFGPVTVNAIIPVIYVILGTEDQRPFPAAGINQLVLCQEKVQIKHAFFKVGLPCQSFCFFF